MNVQVQENRSSIDAGYLMLYMTSHDEWVLRRVDKKLADVYANLFNGAIYLQNLETGAVVKCFNVSFRDICCFNIARARGEFKALGL